VESARGFDSGRPGVAQTAPFDLDLSTRKKSCPFHYQGALGIQGYRLQNRG
jgi:hypothetical protein